LRSGIPQGRQTYRYAHSRAGSVKRLFLFSFLAVLATGVTGYFLWESAKTVQLPLISTMNDQEIEGNASQSCPTGPGALGGKSGSLTNGSLEVTEVTGPGDTLLSVLGANISDDMVIERVAESLMSTIQAHLKTPFDPNSPLKLGRRYSVTVDKEGMFVKATIELEPSQIFHCAVADGGLKSWREEVVLEFKTETVCVTLIGDLTESVLNAGEGVELALKLSSVFRWDIDFRSESIRGDVCRVLFERRYADDRPSGYGRILSAVYEGRKTGRKTAVLFNNTYFDEKGVELKKNFLRSPLSVLKVTSRYGNRFHPVLRVWRKHNGVDYGAPQGTPVWAIANGVVTFAGWSNGYGNYICVKHENGYESRYGHLQRMVVQKGQRVKQRQKIGTVGMTGIATGPHLDFQLLIAGKNINPLGVKMLRDLRSVPEPLKDRFAHVAAQYQVMMGLAPDKEKPRLAARQ